MSDSVDLTLGWRALEAPVWALVRLAEITAAAYQEIENPGDRGSMETAAEWFPKIEDALREAGLRE